MRDSEEEEEEQRVVELLREHRDPRFGKRPVENMGTGVFYFGEGDLPAGQDTFVYCDHQWSFKLSEYKDMYPDRCIRSNRLVYTEMKGRKWVLDGENSERLGPFVNHSKEDANLRLRRVMVQGKLIGFFGTTKIIKHGDQLFWDYLPKIDCLY